MTVPAGRFQILAALLIAEMVAGVGSISDASHVVVAVRRINAAVAWDASTFVYFLIKQESVVYR